MENERLEIPKLYLENVLVTVSSNLAKVLDYNMVYSQGLPNDKKVG